PHHRDARGPQSPGPHGRASIHLQPGARADQQDQGSTVTELICQGPRPSTGKSSSLTRPHTRPGDQGSDPLLRPAVSPERTPAGRHMCAVGGGGPASPHPCVKLSTGLCVALPQLARYGHHGPSSCPSPLVQQLFPGQTGFLAPNAPSTRAEEEPHPATLPTTVAQDFRRPVDNPVHSLFVLVHGFCPRPEKNFSELSAELSTGPPQKLWTTLWITCG